MGIGALSPSAPLSASFPLLSSVRCDFVQSFRPSVQSFAPSSSDSFLPIHQRRPKHQVSSSRHAPPLWGVSSSDSGDIQMIPASDNGSGFNVISVLLLTAFVGLSLLTVGVIYLAVQDFLQKREREKFEKEEAEKKKKSGKKKKVRARSGPRGFGQKIDDDDDD